MIVAEDARRSPNTEAPILSMPYSIASSSSIFAAVFAPRKEDIVYFVDENRDGAF